MKIGFYSLILSALLSSPVFAQVGLEGFSSGRYEIRKAKPRKPSSEEAKKNEIKESEKKPTETAEASVAATPAATAVTVTAPQTAAPPSVTPAVVESQEPSIGEQAESLFSNKAEKIYDFYRVQVHPDDVRNNKVELEIVPALAYVDSQSNYSFRTYQSLLNAVKFKTNVWFTPRLGVSGQFMFSLAGDMDSVNGSSRIPAKYEFLDLGINARKFFGISRLSNSVDFSLLFSENKVQVSNDNTSRPRLKTSGLGVGIKARVPTSESYAWTFGGSFFPRLQHMESETGVAIQSGASAENIRLGLDLGGELKFSRESQMIWSVGLSTERNTFDGPAAIPDPTTGATPDNVSVTNSLYMFSLGYRWGH